MKTITAALVFAAGLALLAGCSTPETRIKSNPEAFNRLTPPQQEMIRKGEVGIGFTKAMVTLALGTPDRVYQRTDRRGASETWSYMTYETPDGLMLYGGYYHSWWRGYYPYYLDYPYRRDYARVRVVFDQDGKVSSVEQRLDN